jgi:acetyl esterase/lipase
MPTVPSKRPILEFFARRGWWAFHFRYRGTWESGGLFLRRPPDRDVTDIVDCLPRGFTELWGGRKFSIPKPRVAVLGSSFGGTAAIMASRDPRVKRAVAFSPVADWREESKAEPLDWLVKFTAAAFGSVYRFAPEDWKKLKGGTFFNPVAHEDEFDGRKIMIFHAQDDRIVPWRPTAVFAKRVGAELAVRRRGGHLRLGDALRPPYWRRVRRFLKSV